MMNINGKNIDLVMIEGKKVGQMMIDGNIIKEAGNFRTADGMILQTDDKKIFNVKQNK